MHFLLELQSYQPCCEQEKADKALMLSLVETYPDSILTRACTAAHLTGSSMIFNETRDKVLMVYHNLYQSWTWTGGHADGESNLLHLAIQEAKEETGITQVKPLFNDLACIDVLPVSGHVKGGNYVSAHLHLSFAYLLQASESQPLSVKMDENSGICWIPIAQLEEKCTEPKMLPVYRKLIEKMRCV